MGDTGMRPSPAPGALAAAKARAASLGSRSLRHGQAPSSTMLRPERPWTSLRRRMSPSGRNAGAACRQAPPGSHRSRQTAPTTVAILCRSGQIEAPHRASSLRDWCRRLASRLAVPVGGRWRCKRLPSISREQGLAQARSFDLRGDESPAAAEIRRDRTLGSTSIAEFDSVPPGCRTALRTYLEHDDASFDDDRKGPSPANAFIASDATIQSLREQRGLNGDSRRSVTIDGARPLPWFETPQRRGGKPGRVGAGKSNDPNDEKPRRRYRAGFFV